MKVFISWSGEQSHAVALILRDWLPLVIQVLQPWVSSEDIRKGTKWAVDLAQELEHSFYGIICVTKANRDAPWINFEAGALSRLAGHSHVSPFVIDLKKVELRGPLGAFQATAMEKEDFRKLVVSLNTALGERAIPESTLKRAFDALWPELEKGLQQIPSDAANSQVDVVPPSKVEAMVEQLLELSRSQNQTLNRLSETKARGVDTPSRTNAAVIQRIKGGLRFQERLLESIHRLVTLDNSPEERQALNGSLINDLAGLRLCLESALESPILLMNSTSLGGGLATNPFMWREDEFNGIDWG